MSIGISSEAETYCCFSHSFSLPPDLEVTEIPEFSSEVTKKSFGEPLDRPPCPFTCTWLQMCMRARSYLFWCIHICPVPHLTASFHSLSTLFSFCLSLLSCSHITVNTHRLGLLDHQRPGIFSFQCRTFSFS